MHNYRVFINGREYVVWAANAKAAARTVSFHHYYLTARRSS